MTKDKREPDLVDDAREEIVGMARQGMRHPTTRPVLTGAAVGAVAGLVLPVVSWPVGLVAGAGVALYLKIRK